MNYPRLFAATALSVFTMLPNQGFAQIAATENNVTPENNLPYDFGPEECLEDIVDLPRMVMAFATPSVRDRMHYQSDCISVMQYHLAKSGHYNHITLKDMLGPDIASHVDGKLGIETLQAMTRYMINAGLADPRPEIAAANEANTTPEMKEIIAELLGSLPQDELSVYILKINERYKNRMVELGDQSLQNLSQAFFYCVQAEAMKSGVSFSMYKTMLADSANKFGTHVENKCTPLLKELSEDRSERARNDAKAGLLTFIEEWEKKANATPLPPKKQLEVPEESDIQSDDCVVSDGFRWVRKCNRT